MGVVEKAGGPLRLAVFIVAGLILFAVIAAASLWAMDYAVQATIVDKDCQPGGQGSVSVQERVTRLVHTQAIASEECLFAQEGHVAEYNVRSERLRLYTPAGQCYWDSEGLQDCAASGVL